MKTVITGSIAYDYLMSFPGRFREHLLPDQLEKVSVSFLVDSLRRQRGGVAANIAYTLAILGGRPTIMAAVGQDFTEYEGFLRAQGVDTSAIVVFVEDFCASFFVSTDQEQNQIASFYAGAMANAAQLTFADLAPDAQLALISPNAPEAMRAYVAECQRREIPYIYDPSQQIIRLSGSDLLKGLEDCHLLTANEYELHMIAQKTGLTLDDILSRTGGVVLTKGKEGATIYIDEMTYDIPAVPPRSVAEPTGAGDAFRAGLIRGMQLDLPWETCGRIGAVAAAYVLEHVGTQGHGFTSAEFVARYRQEFDDQGALDVLLANQTSPPLT
ncbi:MAG: carbohydrate kinase family protein [Candidatus Promineifilaceae bacterium]|nr:carbohydrate kinase family protein [Candidatus Promineifilaceae bacterium]